MFSKKLIASSTIAIACVSSALAQSTLGEAIDMGAEKVLKDEFLTFLPVTMKAVTSTGRAVATLKFKADGDLSGYVESREGYGTSGSFGTWTMDESGKKCIDETLSKWNMNWKECTYIFKISGRYFRVSEDLNRDQKITFYDFKIRDN